MKTKRLRGGGPPRPRPEPLGRFHNPSHDVHERGIARDQAVDWPAVERDVAMILAGFYLGLVVALLILKGLP